MARRYGSSLSCGFTLLEILVVVLIIGIIASFAVLALGKHDRQLEEETKRLSAVISLSAEESILQGRELALEFDSNGYHFLAYDGKQWQDLQDDGPLKTHTLPIGTSVSLSMEGESVALSNALKNGLQGNKGDQAKENEPRIYIFSSGEMTAFRLTLHGNDGQTYQIEGDEHGKLKWADNGAG